MERKDIIEGQGVGNGSRIVCLCDSAACAACLPQWHSLTRLLVKQGRPFASQLTLVASVIPSPGAVQMFIDLKDRLSGSFLD